MPQQVATYVRLRKSRKSVYLSICEFVHMTEVHKCQTKISLDLFNVLCIFDAVEEKIQ